MQWLNEIIKLENHFKINYIVNRISTNRVKILDKIKFLYGIDYKSWCIVIWQANVNYYHDLMNVLRISSAAVYKVNSLTIISEDKWGDKNKLES